MLSISCALIVVTPVVFITFKSNALFDRTKRPQGCKI